MPIKALIFDLDGTTIPSQEDALPTLKVIEAIKFAQTKIITSTATGRPLDMCRQIFKTLSLKSPCIISGGSQIIDPVTEKILWEKLLPDDVANELLEKCRHFDLEIYFNNEVANSPHSESLVTEPIRIMYLINAKTNDLAAIREILKPYANLAVHELDSWVSGGIDFHITHNNATKKHALEILKDMLNISTAEVMVVGDSNNDIPLFESAGLKIAMGNATNYLKALSDDITLDIDHDGLATAIYKYLN